VDVALLQQELGNACGICCQKVSEAEAFVRGGIRNILISNQVRDPAKIDRLARLPRLGARTIVCVDDIVNVRELSDAAVAHETVIECLVELDCGAKRCGVSTTGEVVEIAKAIADASGLIFSGIQAYHGNMQHLEFYDQREEQIDTVIMVVREAVKGLSDQGFDCEIVGGAGTGSYCFEGGSGVFNELQCGSYAFMDADYGRVRDKHGVRLVEGEWENALFVLTSIMSNTISGQAVCDAGLKSHSIDSGLPELFGRNDLKYAEASDEHGVITDPDDTLHINQKLRIVPGHCDPTCNLHDWYVGIRKGKVEEIWPVTARGLAY
jgi:3-hydroxy-D-aspartate aldolase